MDPATRPEADCRPTVACADTEESRTAREDEDAGNGAITLPGGAVMALYAPEADCAVDCKSSGAGVSVDRAFPGHGYI